MACVLLTPTAAGAAKKLFGFSVPQELLESFPAGLFFRFLCKLILSGGRVGPAALAALGSLGVVRRVGLVVIPCHGSCVSVSGC